MQDEYLTVLYIKHFHSLRVVMSKNGHRMLVAQNPGVHLAHWYIINNPCNCSSKHTDVSPVGLPCQCVYAHVCLCMWVSPAWDLGLCKVAKAASVPLNQVWLWIVVMFPGVCMIPAQWQPSFHTVESWFSCMWHGCVNETLLHCTSLHECAVTRGTLSNGPAAIPAGPPTARPISGYCLGQPWVQRPPGQTLLPFSQYCPPPPPTHLLSSLCFALLLPSTALPWYFSRPLLS